MLTTSKRDEFHFLELRLTNVRSFGGEQVFDFRSSEGKASRWCVILGENGVGKTTAMQALAMMRPAPAFERGQDGQVIHLEPKNDELPDPDWIEPDVFDYQNQQLLNLIRQGGAEVAASMTVTLVGPAGEQVTIGFDSVSRDEKLASAEPRPQKRALNGKGPLIIGYGASRHTGTRNLVSIADQRPTESLFDDLVELVDAEEVLEQFYREELAARDEKRDEEAEKYKRIRTEIIEVVRAMTPDLQAINAGARKSISFQTLSAKVGLSGLSLGYRVVVSWIVDLAWRLYHLRPDGLSPFKEHAIVIVDEVDLHLHPRWQREIRHKLLAHFPNVQFIVTTHSPIVAQEAVASGDPVAVVRWNGTAAEVINDPLPHQPWRYDEILGSAAFGFASGQDVRSSELLVERERLLRKHNLDLTERARLTTLNGIAHSIETGDTPYDAAFDKLMERVVELEKQLADRR
ncbi:AAA family ATPase [uncultured Enterovirga sp.]|uniref:AAA family ATPase n=1 Tax=uncultured Enterovirga sp. TaxID=2026352 RepID=UPI0035CA61F9